MNPIWKIIGGEVRIPSRFEASEQGFAVEVRAVDVVVASERVREPRQRGEHRSPFEKP